MALKFAAHRLRQRPECASGTRKVQLVVITRRTEFVCAFYCPQWRTAGVGNSRRCVKWQIMRLYARICAKVPFLASKHCAGVQLATYKVSSKLLFANLVVHSVPGHTQRRAHASACMCSIATDACVARVCQLESDTRHLVIACIWRRRYTCEHLIVHFMQMLRVHWALLLTLAVVPRRVIQLILMHTGHILRTPHACHKQTHSPLMDGLGV